MKIQSGYLRSFVVYEIESYTNIATNLSMTSITTSKENPSVFTSSSDRMSSFSSSSFNPAITPPPSTFTSNQQIPNNSSQFSNTKNVVLTTEISPKKQNFTENLLFMRENCNLENLKITCQYFSNNLKNCVQNCCEQINCTNVSYDLTNKNCIVYEKQFSSINVEMTLNKLFMICLYKVNFKTRDLC